jgi:YHS domain-containing protein
MAPPRFPMFRYLIVEILLPLLLFLLVRSIFKSIFQTSKDVSRQASPAPSAQGPTVIAGGELKKDPVCGTYVSTSLAITRNVKGEVVYFCSNECRNKFVG